MIYRKALPNSPTQLANWLNLAIAIAIIIASVTLITLLHRREDEGRRIEILFARMNGLINQLSIYEWETVAQRKLVPKVSDRANAVRAQIDDILSELGESNAGDQRRQQITGLYHEYITAMDEEFSFLASGSITQAIAIDEERVDPAFIPLSKTIAQIYTESTASAEQANVIVDGSYILLSVLTVAVLAWLFWRFQRVRYAVELAMAEKKLLHQAHTELEHQVEKRTEELTNANKLLQTEVEQRKQAEAGLQTAKAELERRVVERTVALQETNERLEHELTERKRAEVQIMASLQEKVVLLKEVHHRVKNNLQVISSLLYLQSDKIKDQQALEIFRDSQNRVRSMALIHEKLYLAKDLAKIDLSGYIHSLIGYLFRSYGTHASAIQLQVLADDVALGIDIATPCGLIINELVSNALKHAFPNGRAGQIQIELRAEPEKYFTLCVSDDGVGFPAEVDFQNTNSLGLQLVNTLVAQLDGAIQLQRVNGTAFKIRFKEAK